MWKTFIKIRWRSYDYNDAPEDPCTAVTLKILVWQILSQTIFHGPFLLSLKSLHSTLTNKRQRSKHSLVTRHSTIPPPPLELILALMDALLHSWADHRHMVLMPSTYAPLSRRQTTEFGTHSRLLRKEVWLVRPFFEF